MIFLAYINRTVRLAVIFLVLAMVYKKRRPFDGRRICLRVILLPLFSLLLDFFNVFRRELCPLERSSVGEYDHSSHILPPEAPVVIERSNISSHVAVLACMRAHDDHFPFHIDRGVGDSLAIDCHFIARLPMF